MRHTRFAKAIAMLLCFVMVVSTLPITALAASTSYENAQLTVASEKKSTLAPGVTLDQVVVYDQEGSQVKMFVTTADVNLDTVKLFAGHKDMDPTRFGLASLTDQVETFNELAAAGDAYYQGTVVAAVNASYFNTGNGRPNGVFVMNGVDMTESDSKGNKYGYFALMKDGTYKIGTKGEYTSDKGNIQEGVALHYMLVENGKMVEGLDNPNLTNSGKYPRQTIGITADGKVILMTADGLQAPNTVGLTIPEQAQVMLDLGCVWAGHLDGGASATYGAKMEGSDEFEIVNSPSGGGARAVSNTLFVVSTVISDGVFNNAVLTAEHEYVTPGSEVKLSAAGADKAGSAAEIPADVVWQVADPSLGTVSNGVFISSGKTGDAVVQMVYGGNVVGETVIHVVVPTAIAFNSSNITVPYGKTVTLRIKATVNDGMNQVVYNDGDIVFALSDATIGAVDGMTFTAAAMDSGAASEATITATFAGTEVATSAAIKLGRGSEIVEDFESGETTFVAAPMYPNDNTMKTTSAVVTAENGKVRSGENALAIYVDAQDTTYYIYSEGFLVTNTGDQLKGLKGATAIGFWMYFPEDINALECVVRTFAAGKTNTANRTNTTAFNIDFSVDHEMDNWYYVSADLTNAKTNTNGLDFAQLRFTIRDAKNVGNFIAAENDTTIAGKYTIYIDDITIDYSDAVEDREVPEFENIQFSGLEEPVDMNGQTISESNIFVSVQAQDHVADNSVGLDISSAKAYVDGVDVTDKLSCSDTGMMGLQMMNLSDGAHTFRFEIADNNGNTAAIERYVVIDTSSAPVATITMQNPAADKLLADSVHWLDLKVDNLAAVEELTTVINLNGINHWILDQIVVADGFDVEYSIEKNTNDVLFSFTRNGKPVSGNETVLMSFPVRIWYSDTYDDSNPDPEEHRNGHWERHLVVRTNYGVIKFADGTTDTFSATPIKIHTEMTESGGLMVDRGEQLFKWHSHTAEPVADGAATCLTPGYTGRTYCAVCDSVVDWGEKTEDAKGHTYIVIDGELVCECGLVYTGTGLVTIGDKNYYLIAGKLKNGWVQIEEDWYYFDNTTYATVESYNNGNVTFTFEADGKLVSGQWYNTSKGSRYYYGPDYYTGNNWGHKRVTIDGKDYVFDAKGYCLKGIAFEIIANSTVYQWYDFGEDGAIKSIYDYTGLIEYNGHTYSVKDGVTIYGMSLVDGAYYYAGSANNQAVVKNTERSCPITNDLLPVGTYKFGADGKMLNPPVQPEDPKPENPKPTGKLVKDSDGEIRYYVDGVATYAGLVQDEDGNYYYINSALKAVKNREYTIGEAKANGLLPAGTYTFGADGKMVASGGGSGEPKPEDPKPEDPKPTGKLVKDSDGEIRYYVDGVATYAGLVKDADGNYYYINSTLKAVRNRKYEIGAAKTNGLVGAGTYEFDADGKMKNPSAAPAVKNGLVKDDDGEIRYYVNDVATYAGLVKDSNGNYYYINSTLKAVKNCEYEIGKAKANGLLSAGTYTFGADGKLVP